MKKKYISPKIDVMYVMAPAAFELSAWQCMKIGAGPVPVKTSEGWLLFYHGVLRSCNGYVYAFGSALLDLEQPWMAKSIPSTCSVLLLRTWFSLRSY